MLNIKPNRTKLVALLPADADDHAGMQPPACFGCSTQRSDNGGKGVFVHISAVQRVGLSSLKEGTKFSYEETDNRGKGSAENLPVG